MKTQKPNNKKITKNPMKSNQIKPPRKKKIKKRNLLDREGEAGGDDSGNEENQKRDPKSRAPGEGHG